MYINEKEDGPRHGFGYLGLVSDSRFDNMEPKRITVILTFQQGSRFKG